MLPDTFTEEDVDRNLEVICKYSGALEELDEIQKGMYTQYQYE